MVMLSLDLADVKLDLKLAHNSDAARNWFWSDTILKQTVAMYPNIPNIDDLQMMSDSTTWDV